MHICIPHTRLVPKEARKRIWDPQELELQIIVNNHVCDETEPRPSRTARALNS